MPSSRPVVYLHIGPPKTGTTYLQDILWRNRKRLVAHDVTIPGARQVEPFHAALDLRGIAFGGFVNPDTAGAWPRLAHHTRKAATSRSVISHEVFAGADEAEIIRMVRDLGSADVHVIYGCRDLARQLPAVWQESLKNRRTRAYDAFLQRALHHGERAQGPGFWRAQDTLATLSRWSGPVPAQRIHVVTLPPRDAPADTLWRRFCQVLGIDPGGYDIEVARANPSLSTVDAELLRRLNESLPGDMAWPRYERLVKRRFNHRADTRGPGERLRVPPRYHSRIVELTEQTRAGLEKSGYNIVGDLDDLTPAETDFAEVGVVSPDLVTAAALDLLATVLSGEHSTSRPAPRNAARTILRHLRRARGTS